MKKHWFIFAWLLPLVVIAQNERLSSAEIYKDLQKLENTTTVMYLAAHPDDENTRLISWLTNHENVRTVYLSLTRGDGGQNRIGTEQGEALGVLRTQELLAARSVDGGEQTFTRAKDFGYSKSVDETFIKWNHDTLLKDVVFNIRKFKPDVIITRFPPDKRAGHGHHTASAILAAEAFDLANDPTKYPESAHLYGVYQPKRILFNTSRWFGEEWINEHLDELYTIDIGEYDPVLGKSYSEIAAIARSQHRCQAFGTAPTYGEQFEYLLHVKGDSSSTNNVFEGIPDKWNSLTRSKKIKKEFARLIEGYNAVEPSQSVGELFELRKLLKEEPQSPFIDCKIQQLEQLILDCSGLWAEYLTVDAEASIETTIQTKIEVVNQGKTKVKLLKVTYDAFETKEIDSVLVNKVYSLKAEFFPKKNSAPYWLQQPDEQDIYYVEEMKNVCLPNNKPSDEARLIFEINGKKLTVTRGLTYKYTDRSIGERYNAPFNLPEITASFSKDMTLFTQNNRQSVLLTITANHDITNEQLRTKAPSGWDITPKLLELKNLNKGKSISFEVSISPSKNAQNGKFEVVDEKGEVLKMIQVIDYPHIEKQLLLPSASVDLIYDNMIIPQLKVGYIHGAGDKVPEMLQQVGVEIELLTLDQISLSKLKEFDAVVAGVRLYNVYDMSKYQPALMEYVKEGGNYIVQYVTTYSLKNEVIGPYNFTLSKERVTDENATPNFITPNHKVLQTPNKIELSDFDNWVQERGLYFADQWSQEYQPIIGWHDVGEENVNGGLLIAPYGKGYFTYTGISFFRELPVGVPGAYKLMINLLSLSK